MRRKHEESIQKTIPMRPLFTERLVLRKLRTDDADEVFEYARRPDVTARLLWDPHPSLGYTRNYLAYLVRLYREGKYFDWAVTLRDTGRLIGTAGFSAFFPDHAAAEIGYVINPRFSGMGYATEAVRELLRFGFYDLGLHRIQARCFSDHAASLSVMKKNRMKPEGTAKDALYVKGAYRDITTCAIVADDFFL